MADLHPLIRLHKYELDEKRRALSSLYSSLGLLERAREKLEADLLREKEAADKVPDASFTFASYAETVRRKREEMDRQEAELEKHIESAKQDMLESFAELKKYEMTQAERDRLEEEERRVREDRMMDEIGLEGYRRKKGE